MRSLPGENKELASTFVFGFQVGAHRQPNQATFDSHAPKLPVRPGAPWTLRSLCQLNPVTGGASARSEDAAPSTLAQAPEAPQLPRRQASPRGAERDQDAGRQHARRLAPTYGLRPL